MGLHSDICLKACAWLKQPASRKGPGCQFAFTETRPGGEGEIPDAIGFRYGRSVVVEVKTSRADFFADRKKEFRIDAKAGMGIYRYFFTPEGLILPEELPERWGLVYVRPRGLKVMAGHVLLKRDGLKDFQHERCLDSEVRFLSGLLARVADPEMVNRQLKEQNRIVSSLQRENERLRKQLSQAQDAFWRERLKNDDKGNGGTSECADGGAHDPRGDGHLQQGEPPVR